MTAITIGDGFLDVDKKLSAPALPDLSLILTEQMVDIYVGAERKKFHLHRELLCNRSDYFKGWFEATIDEALEREIDMPEYNTKSFTLFTGWLYGGSLKSIGSKDEMRTYFALAIFADKFFLEHLQNEAMDHILRFHRTNRVCMDIQTLRYIYENTSDQDIIREFPLALAAWMALSKYEVGLPESYQFLVRAGGDLAVDFADSLLKFEDASKGDLEVIKEIDPRRLSNCTYHKHTSPPFCGERSG